MDAKPLRTGGQVEDILVRYQNTVYGLALARTGSRADAEDVFQESCKQKSIAEMKKVPQNLRD